MIKSILLALLSTLMVCQVAFAKQMTDEKGAGACAALFGGFIFIIIAIFVINIAILVWVSRDAKARGSWFYRLDGPSIFAGFIGLIIYFFSRPKGEVVVCSHCNNKRLKAMAKCPHCGN